MSKSLNIFVTGISTDVGKTVASAIITESLQADYWKPVQAGDLKHSDSKRVRALVSNSKTVVHPEAYRLNTPASPHLAAERDGITINIDDIIRPLTSNHLVTEGAGGIFVPLNAHHTVADLILPDHQVVVVSRHYLGSINHTLLTIEVLRSRNLNIAGIIFSGDEYPSTESIIAEKTGVRTLGRINNEPYFDSNVIADYAEIFRPALTSLIGAKQ